MTNLDYLYNPPAAAKHFDRDCFVDKQPGFTVVERGAVVPFVPIVENSRRILEFGGVVDGDGRFIKSSVGRFGADDRYTSNKQINYVPATVIYLGLFYPIWGHFITEGLRYFWFLSSEIFKRRFKDCPLVYVPYEGKWRLERMKNFRRLAELAGVDISNLVPLERPVRFANVILPDESFFMTETGRYFTAEYRATIECLKSFALKNRTPTASRKVYYFYGRHQVGEERLAEYFKSKGYTIVQPEKLTTDEQLNLLINAESFASTLGSCAHNSVFLRNGTETIFIPRAANRLTDYQQVIDQVAGLNANYIDSSLSIFETVNDAYCLIISPQLKKFFGDAFDGYAEDDFKIFLTYIKTYAGKGFNLNEDAVQYYAPSYYEFLNRLTQRQDLLQAYGVTLT